MYNDSSVVKKHAVYACFILSKLSFLSAHQHFELSAV